MNILNFTNRIGNLIGANNLETAIFELSKLLQKSPKLDELIVQSARYNDIMKQIRLGIIDFESAEVTKNKIRYAILDLLREIENGVESDPELKEEIENLNTSHSSMKITQSHYGGGDNIGRDKIVNKHSK